MCVQRKLFEMNWVVMVTLYAQLVGPGSARHTSTLPHLSIFDELDTNICNYFISFVSENSPTIINNKYCFSN